MRHNVEKCRMSNVFDSLGLFEVVSCEGKQQKENEKNFATTKIQQFYIVVI